MAKSWGQKPAALSFTESNLAINDENVIKTDSQGVFVFPPIRSDWQQFIQVYSGTAGADGGQKKLFSPGVWR